MTHEERDEDGSVHHDQSQNGGPSVAEFGGDGTGEEDANESTALTGLEKGTLPSCGDGIDTWMEFDTVFSLEGLESNEVSIQEHVEGFHDLVKAS